MKESMAYLYFRLNQSMVWKMDLEEEVEILFVSKVKEEHEKYEACNKLLCEIEDKPKWRGWGSHDDKINKIWISTNQKFWYKTEYHDYSIFIFLLFKS